MIEPVIEANEKLTLFCSIDGLAVEHKVRYGQYDIVISYLFLKLKIILCHKNTDLSKVRFWF